MIGKFLVRLGTWINKHFPEKVSTDEIRATLNAIELRLHAVTVLENGLQNLMSRHTALTNDVLTIGKKVESLASENTALKAASALRVRSAIPMPGR